MNKAEKLKALIEEGYKVRDRNIKGEPIQYISGEEYEAWISKITLYVKSAFPDNPLEEKFLLYTAKAVGFGVDRFDAIIGILKALESIDPEERTSQDISVGPMAESKIEMIFISHATQDSQYAELLVKLLADIGLTKDRNTIFCSSVHGYDIPLGEDIYDYLKKQFNKNAWVIFLLTDNYYKSAACLNEMGATWVMQKKYTTILVPPFGFSQIKGAINPMMISFAIDNSKALNKFRAEVQKTFELPQIDVNIWESERDEFLSKIEKQIRDDIGKNADRKVSIEDTTENLNNEVEILLRFDNKSPVPAKCRDIIVKLLDFENNQIDFHICGDFLDSKIIYGLENRVEKYTIGKNQIPGGEKFNFRRMKKWDTNSFWGSI